MDVSANRFLEGFSPEGRACLLEHLKYQALAPGEYLFREGDPADGICLILEGEIEIARTLGNHAEILNSFQAGDSLGEVAVLDGQGRSTDARAKGAATVATIPSELLFEVLDREPVTLTLRLFQNVISHLRRSNDLFVNEVVRKEKLSLVGEMASSLMHDLRNPIAGIHLAADLITMNHTDAETVHCCDKIRLQCDRVVAMAGELLEFSRGESKLDLRDTETTSFISHFANLNEDYLAKTGIKFNFQAEPSPIRIDPMRMMRLLQNLVSNAVDALRSQPDGHIEVTGWVDEEVFYLTVADNGPGIPEVIRDRIFEAFVTHGKKGGTGLGMAVAYNVVLAHGGTITFETETGKGTTFLVQIPQGAPAAADGQIHPATL